MKYSSLQEYFYKFFNLLYTLCLAQLLVLVVLYWLMLGGKLTAPLHGDPSIRNVLLIVMGVMVFSDWVISFVYFNNGLKSIRKLPSLGARLDRYYSLTIVRFAIILSGCILMAVGLYLTEGQLFTLAAIVNLVLVLLLWPLPSKVCRDLQLKGDERTLVLYKKERLH